jgi:hypothetical protein
LAPIRRFWVVVDTLIFNAAFEYTQLDGHGLSLRSATILSVVLVGLLPAIRASQVKSLLPESGGFRHRKKLGQSLVVIQVGMSLVLLAGAGLLV